MDGSILYRGGAEYTDFDPDVLADLRIDAVLAEIAGADGTAGAPYRQKPKNFEDVQFRLAVMRDLERPGIRAVIDGFMTRHVQYRTCLEYSGELPQRQTRQKWLLDAAHTYCGCLAGLRAGLEDAAPESDGLRRFLERLRAYMESEEFTALRSDAAHCAGRLDAVRYTMDVWLYQGRAAVRAEHERADDYCGRLARVFGRYGIAPGPKMVPFPGVNMETLELAVLDRLGELFPGEFRLLDGFCLRHPAFDAALADAFAAELRFYLSYTAYMDRMKAKGYPFSYPEFHEQKTVAIRAGYDLSLAQAAGAPVTPNDFSMEAGESFVVTGPNQGGKTAYARMAGQVEYFACLGLPAPCAAVETYFVEGIRTHFAREEDPGNNYGRLKEELQRAKGIIDALPRDGMVIFNDLFSSTTTHDALELGKKLLDGLKRRGCLCLFVTNFHELADPDRGLVCLRAAPDESGAYRVTHGPAGKASANRLMADYRLCYEDIRSRIP